MKRCHPALLIVMCLTGCGAHTSMNNPVVDHYWGLREIQNVKIEKAEIELATVRFRTDGGVDGTAICNSISTGLTWSSPEVAERGHIVNAANRPLIKTAVGCGAGDDNNVADKFWKKMEGSGQWLLNGRRLRIVFRDGTTAELVAVPTPASERRPSCAENDPNNFDCQSRR